MSHFDTEQGSETLTVPATCSLLRAAAGRFVVGVLGVLVARDLKVFYTHKFYTHAFFLDFCWICFWDFLGFFRILRAKSIFRNGLRNVFSEQSHPKSPKKIRLRRAQV